MKTSTGDVAAAPSCNLCEEKDTHLTRLILEKQDAKKRIEGLEVELGRLRTSVEELRRHAANGELLAGDTGELVDGQKSAIQPPPSLGELSTWNNDLIHTVERLQGKLIQVESESQLQMVSLSDQVRLIADENDRLRAENDALKTRVADDVLRQRQTNRIEMAFERARIASRVREASQRRLEYVEGSLMEAHDDLYHVQRWDAGVLPQREVCFVFHYAGELKYPLGVAEEFAMEVYHAVLGESAAMFGGYRVGFYRGWQSFVFQAPQDALDFSKRCHEQLVVLPWPSRIETVPALSTVASSGTVLFKGPRLYTCIYACTPESYIDPVSGRYAYFGPEVTAAVSAAVEQAPVGEIVVNEAWARLFCQAKRIHENSAAPVRGDAADIREGLGKGWDVVGLPGACGIVASILPDSLKERRGVQPHALHPAAKYPCMQLEEATTVPLLVKSMKGTITKEGETQSSGPTAVDGQQNRRRVAFLSDAAGVIPQEAVANVSTGVSDDASRILSVFTLQTERDTIAKACRKTEMACAAHERDRMAAEDRFEITKQKTLDDSETAFVCTIDTGDDTIWKKILVSSISAEQYDVIRDTIRSHIHIAARVHYGFLMNGNYSDVFTYVFREVEQALAFVSEVYIKVNRTGTKYAHTSLGSGRDIFLFRAGISSGPMSSIYRAVENGMLKCTGPAIRLSGTLCDLAQNGEILAMEDVTRMYHSKQENVVDTQYNIVRHDSQFLSGCNAPAVVHSILPKPFAYRRAKLMEDRSGAGSTAANRRDRLYLPYRSVAAALTMHVKQLPRSTVSEMLEQQQRRLERVEECRMRDEDTFEEPRSSSRAVSLRNPWMLLAQPQAEQTKSEVQHLPRRGRVSFRSAEDLENDLLLREAREIQPLAFLYCDLAGAIKLAKQLPVSLWGKVLAHYNYVVQEVCRQMSCAYVAKTNSTTAYLIIFTESQAAVEAARWIQLNLVHSRWPDELKTLESSLYVKDGAQRGTLLFAGPRAQMAVHVSDKYKWRRLNHSEESAGVEGLPAVPVVDVRGPAVAEAYILGRSAHGGEIRLSRVALDAIGKNPSGKLLSQQFAMQLVPRFRVMENLPTKWMGSSHGGEEEEEGGDDSGSNAGNSVALSSSRGRRSVTSNSLRASSAAGSEKNRPSSRQSGARDESEEALFDTSVTEGCVAAVPRQLEGRLRMLLFPVFDEEIEGEGGLRSKRSSSRSIVPPAPPPVAAQKTWISDSESARNALPKAARTMQIVLGNIYGKAVLNEDAREDYEITEEEEALPVLCEPREEAKRIGRLLEELVAMYPTPTHLSVDAVEDPERNEDVNATSGSDSARRTSPPSVSRKLSSAARKQSEKSGRVSPKPVTDHYVDFMDLARYVLSLLLNALYVGAEAAAPAGPPPLPTAFASVAVLSSNSSDTMSVGVGRRPGGNSDSAVQGAADANARSPGRVPRSRLPSINAATRSGRPSVATAADVGSLPRPPSASSLVADKLIHLQLGLSIDRNDPYKAAMDYLLSSYSAFLQMSSAAAEKAAIPAAPSAGGSRTPTLPLRRKR